MSINEKILKIQTELNVEKTGYDERNDYHYFKAEDVARSVRQELVKNGIIHRSRVVREQVENIVDKQGRVRPAVSGVVEITFIDVEDGTEFVTEALASGSDIGGDKATRKLAVQAFKIAMIDVFTIVEDMAFVDSDGEAPAPSLNEGAEDDGDEKSTEPKLDSKALGAKLSEMINDPDLDHVNNEVAMTVGRRLAKEVLGDGATDRAWRKDATVLDKLIKALEAGELS